MTRTQVRSGPLLDGVIQAQTDDEQATSYPAVAALGWDLIRLVRELGDPVVWPVGASADRLVGVVTLLSEGQVRTTGWTQPPAGQRVLLLTLSALSAIALQAAAKQARRMGAIEVHACGINVRGIAQSESPPGIDGYHVLQPLRESVRGFT